MAQLVFEVEGLKQLARDLRAVDKDLPKQLTRAHKQVSEKLLPGARSAIARQPHKGAPKAASNVRAAATQTSAGIRVTPSAAVPYTASLEFGATVHHVFGRQVVAASMKNLVFLPHNPEGYAVRPEVRRAVEAGLVDDIYADVLTEAFLDHGWR